MHLPDGFLSVPVSAALTVATVGGVGAALHRVQAAEREPANGPSMVPLMGVCAAFVFAAQMFNFPISGGTTGHLLGAALATALLGPWRALVVMATVLIVQAFMFADGGLVALGGNIFNMGVAGCLVSGLVIPAVQRLGRGRAWARQAAVAAAAWLTVMTAAGLTAVEIGVSGNVPLAVVVPAMLAVHAVIGLGEALLSVVAYNVVVGAKPELAAAGRVWALEQGAETWRLAAVLALGLVVVALAFPQPDGLEWVAEQQGFLGQAAAPFAHAPLPDYALPGRAAGEGFDWLGSYLSAAVGMVVCGGLMLAVGGRRRRTVAES